MEDAQNALQLALLLGIEAERNAQLALILALRRRKRRHRWWVRPWLTIERRLHYGQYETLMQELRAEDVGSFKRYLRITPDMFDEILQRVSPVIQKKIQGLGMRFLRDLNWLLLSDIWLQVTHTFP